MPGFQALILISFVFVAAAMTSLLGVTHFVRSMSTDVLAGLQVLLTVVPTLWLALFAALVVRARLLLGFWPHPAYPDPSEAFGIVWSPLDPKDLGLHYVIVLLLIPVVLFSCVAIAPIWSGLHRRGDAMTRIATRVYVIAMLAFVCLWTVDPGQFVAWFVD